jgi:hypothetical protein
MRRNAIAVVLFALALGLKVLLPAAAAVADASRHRPQQTAFEDCLKAAAADDALGRGQTPGKAQRHAASCPLCQISGEGSLALLERAPQPIPLAFFDRAAPFGPADRSAPRARHAATHQPRGPPHFS